MAVDTNALFDVYRFNKEACEEYLATLRLLGNRLWIPNRVGPRQP
ncbi:PIN-like domain-containing protein [Spirillospora sp. CA-128828]